MQSMGSPSHPRRGACKGGAGVQTDVGTRGSGTGGEPGGPCRPEAGTCPSGARPRAVSELEPLWEEQEDSEQLGSHISNKHDAQGAIQYESVLRSGLCGSREIDFQSRHLSGVSIRWAGRNGFASDLARGHRGWPGGRRSASQGGQSLSWALLPATPRPGPPGTRLPPGAWRGHMRSDCSRGATVLVVTLRRAHTHPEPMGTGALPLPRTLSDQLGTGPP